MKVFRLIEHEPAWEVHAFLRFCGVAYTSEFAPTPMAFGRPLPVVVSASEVYSGEEIFDSPEILSAVTWSEDEKSMNEMVASTVRCTFQRIYDHIIMRRGEDSSIEREYGVVGFGSLVANSSELACSLSFVSKDKYPKLSEVDLLKLLESKYEELNFSLDFARDDKLSVCSCWSSLRKAPLKINRLGKADALLFDHIARAIAHPAIGPVIEKFPNIRKYFVSLCSKYFGPASHPQVKNVWEYSAWRLVENRFLTADSCVELKMIIQQERDLKAAVDMEELRGTMSALVLETMEDAASQWLGLPQALVLPDKLSHKLFAATFLASVGLSLVGYVWSVRR